MSLQDYSNGRLLCGVGVGDYEGDFQAIGVPDNERGVRTEESLQILKKIFKGGSVSHHGKYYNFSEAIFEPAPQTIPIYIGGGVFVKGGDEKDVIVPKVLDRVARLGDGWLPEAAPDSVRAGVDWLNEALPKYGRPKNSIKNPNISNLACAGGHG